MTLSAYGSYKEVTVPTPLPDEFMEEVFKWATTEDEKPDVAALVKELYGAGGGPLTSFVCTSTPVLKIKYNICWIL